MRYGNPTSGRCLHFKISRYTVGEIEKERDTITLKIPLIKSELLSHQILQRQTTPICHFQTGQNFSKIGFYTYQKFRKHKKVYIDEVAPTEMILSALVQ